MRDKKILHIFIGLALLLQALFFQVALPNLVLCFGEDGHLAFEFQVAQESCLHTSVLKNRLFSNAENGHVKNKDAQCTDLYLHFHTSFAHRDFNKQTHQSLNLFFVKPFVSSLLSSGNRMFNARSMIIFPGSFQRLLQTTILLI